MMKNKRRHAPGKTFALACIWFYQKAISGFLPPSCRFQPTCSNYAREAVQNFGLYTGGRLVIRRLLKCHPFYRGPLHDPPPTQIDRKNQVDPSPHEIR